MEFIFELFAEMLGKVDEPLCNAQPTQADRAPEAADVAPEADAQPEPVNIFNVVNFH